MIIIGSSFIFTPWIDHSYKYILWSAARTIRGCYQHIQNVATNVIVVNTRESERDWTCGESGEKRFTEEWETSRGGREGETPEADRETERCEVRFRPRQSHSVRGIDTIKIAIRLQVTAAHKQTQHANENAHEHVANYSPAVDQRGVHTHIRLHSPIVLINAT